MGALKPWHLIIPIILIVLVIVVIIAAVAIISWVVRRSVAAGIRDADRRVDAQRETGPGR